MNDEQWQWWDTLSGVPGEDELLPEPRTFTYMIPSHIDPEALKAKLRARAAANPKPEHWAQKLRRRLAKVWPR